MAYLDEVEISQIVKRSDKKFGSQSSGISFHIKFDLDDQKEEKRKEIIKSFQLLANVFATEGLKVEEIQEEAREVNKAGQWASEWDYTNPETGVTATFTRCNFCKKAMVVANKGKHKCQK